jgi:cytochrome c oxidase subunit II
LNIHAQFKYRLNKYAKRLSARRRFYLLPALPVLLFLAGCASEVTTQTGIPSILDARGPAAAEINVLWWVMFWMSLVIFLGIMVLLTLIIARRGRGGEVTPGVTDIIKDAPDSRKWIWFGGILLPSVVIAIVLLFTLYTLSVTATPQSESEHHYEIYGWMWWWEVRNADLGIATANELYIPVGEPVRLTITSGDVIHSFWVPQLQGKMDAIPGRTNEFWLQADEPGIYRGICAEFCGLQHANMHFILVAVSPEEYQAWVERESADAQQPQDEMAAQGFAVFMNNQCHFCHQVRGTEATGQVGPDLTHFGSRLTLGAGIRENNRGNLAGWISDPQHLKPGNNMPRIRLDSEDLQALLAYLESLE